MEGQSFFYPVHLTFFMVETRKTSGAFIQILMTRFFDLVTGNNLKRWLQQDNLLRSQVVQATTQTQASRTKTARSIKGRKSRWLESGEPRTCSVEKNLRRVNSVDLVTYMLIGDVLVKTCSSNATTAKIWNLRNFANFLLAKNWK